METGIERERAFFWILQRIIEGRTFSNFFDVDGMLQILHVLLIGCDVQDGCGRIGQFDRKLSPLGSQLNGGVKAAPIARVIILVAAIQRQIQGGFVVFQHGNGDVDVRSVTVVDPPVVVVAMQVSRFRVKLQVLVAELPRAETQQHGLHHTLGAHLDQLMAALKQSSVQYCHSDFSINFHVSYYDDCDYELRCYGQTNQSWRMKSLGSYVAFPIYLCF